MPIMMTSRRSKPTAANNRFLNSSDTTHSNGNHHTDTIRVKVKDARRKQQWVDPLPTPPRSPHSQVLDSEEPIIDDLWELWKGTGLIDDDDVDQKFTLDAALNGLGFIDEDQRHSSCSGSYRRLSLGDIDADAEGLFNNFSECDDTDFMTEGENEELLNHLFQYVSDDSPPPTNPPSPPAPGDMEIDGLDIGSHSTFVINTDLMKTEISSGPSSLDGDSSDECSSPSDEAFSSDSGIDEGRNDMSPSYQDGFIGEDFLTDDAYLFADNTFESLLEASKLSTFLEVEEKPELELKHDCMWNGICCPSKIGGKKQEEMLSVSCSPKLENFDEFMKTKIKIEPIGIEVVKPEPVERLVADLGQEDTMCWNNDQYQMWAEETPPPSQDPVIPADVESSNEFKGLDWTDLIDDSKERYELEMLRNATMNDHCYANIHQDPKAPQRIEFPRKGIQGIVLKEENGDDYSGGPRKTKILVPLKDLMDSLQHKHFFVAPLGPGKKVIRLTGSETVKGLMSHAAFTSSFKPVSSYGVPQTSLFHRAANGQNRNNTNTAFQTVMAASNQTTTSSSHSRHKKSKANRSIMREGGTITFPDQVPSPSSPDSPVSESSSSNNSSNLTASGRPKKTKTHNNMERMRRIDLRNSFDSLKKLVPPLAKSTKCSKVEILRRAEEYIRALKSLEKRLQREEATVRSRNEALKLKLLQSQQ